MGMLDNFNPETIDAEVAASRRRLGLTRKRDKSRAAMETRAAAIEKKLNITIPDYLRTDIHMAVMYCHAELEKRRDEQRISQRDGNSHGHIDNARAHTYRRRQLADSNEPTFGHQRKYTGEHRTIGMDSQDSGSRPDHAALRDRSIWLGYRA